MSIFVCVCIFTILFSLTVLFLVKIEFRTFFDTLDARKSLTVNYHNSKVEKYSDISKFLGLEHLFLVLWFVV